MSRNNGRTVYLRSDGRWANKANEALKASGFHNSQAAACAEATAMLETAGGGDLTVKGADGDVERRRVPAASDRSEPLA